MNDFLYFVLGVAVCGLLLTMSASDVLRAGQTALTAVEQCEAALPRNQRCVITAAPEEQVK